MPNASCGASPKSRPCLYPPPPPPHRCPPLVSATHASNFYCSQSPPSTSPSCTSSRPASSCVRCRQKATTTTSRYRSCRSSRHLLAHVRKNRTSRCASQRCLTNHLRFHINASRSHFRPRKIRFPSGYPLNIPFLI